MKREEGTTLYERALAWELLKELVGGKSVKSLLSSTAEGWDFFLYLCRVVGIEPITVLYYWKDRHSGGAWGRRSVDVISDMIRYYAFDSSGWGGDDNLSYGDRVIWLELFEGQEMSLSSLAKKSRRGIKVIRDWASRLEAMGLVTIRKSGVVTYVDTRPNVRVFYNEQEDRLTEALGKDILPSCGV